VILKKIRTKKIIDEMKINIEKAYLLQLMTTNKHLSKFM